MARRGRKQSEDPSGPGEWIVTFSDCMTLLLCFFVLLLTFSSFDEVELQKLAGVFDCQTQDSIFPIPREVKDSVVPPIERTLDMTDEGSEAPTKTDNPRAEFPGKLPAIFDEDAYKDRKVLYLPAEWMFWGQGAVLTAEGRAYLDSIGSFMAVLPGRVIVSESGPSAADPTRHDARLDRAMAVMDHLVRSAKLPRDQFNITASQPVVPARLRGRRVVAVAMITREAY
ncbi:MAG TPA: flagellar motor protein MotB [Phycisphaerae bacterium]|nr:flagellar motor protein MotB [Phycisphaerae bacterium]